MVVPSATAPARIAAHAASCARFHAWVSEMAESAAPAAAVEPALALRRARRAAAAAAAASRTRSPAEANPLGAVTAHCATPAAQQAAVVASHVCCRAWASATAILVEECAPPAIRPAALAARPADVYWPSPTRSTAKTCAALQAHQQRGARCCRTCVCPASTGWLAQGRTTGSRPHKDGHSMHCAQAARADDQRQTRRLQTEGGKRRGGRRRVHHHRCCAEGPHRVKSGARALSCETHVAQCTRPRRHTHIN